MFQPQSQTPPFHTETYRSPSLSSSPAQSLPPLDDSFLLDETITQPPASPGSATGFEPLFSSSPVPTNALHLAVPLQPDIAEGEKKAGVRERFGTADAARAGR